MTVSMTPVTLLPPAGDEAPLHHQHLDDADDGADDHQEHAEVKQQHRADVERRRGPERGSARTWTSRNGMPMNIGTTAAAAAAGQTGHRDGAIVLSRKCGHPRACRRRCKSAACPRSASRPPMKPPPGKLWPAEKHKQRKRHDARGTRAGSSSAAAPISLGPPLEAQIGQDVHAEPRQSQHRNFEHRVKPAEIHQMTLTTLVPWAGGQLFSMYQSATGRAVRSPRAPSSSSVTASPRRPPTSTLTQRAARGNTSRVSRGK